MKPAPFDYLRPATVDEACALLAANSDARLIAGGQTLVPMMAMRLARPSQLIDISRIPALKGIREDGDTIVFGAATRQVDAERSALVAGKLPLLAKALPWVGHAPTRSRGTVGGSVANADPAAEISLVLVTLEGQVMVRDALGTTKGPTTIEARELFLGPMTTSISPTACLTEVRMPVWREANIGVGFHEVSARKSDFAYVSAAAQLAFDGSGKCLRCAVGLGGATPVPNRLDGIETALKGQVIDAPRLNAAVSAAIADIEILHDAHVSDTYRRRVAEALVKRAILDATTAASVKGGRA